MFGAKKKSPSVAAVFDVSSSSVGGAHVLIPHDSSKKISILAQARTDALLQEDINMDRFINDTVKNMESVIERIRKADVHRPSHIQLVLASPWYVSQTRTIQYKREIPFVCTQKLIDSLIQNEVAYILEHDMDRFGGFGKAGVIVEKQLSMIKLNGYGTSNPFGKKATNLELYMTITVTPKLILDRFTDTLRRAYGSKHINVTTSPYTTFIVARDYFNAAHECVIIDVGEEITDVAFVKDGLFLYQHSFPVGTYELYRTLGESAGHSTLEAKTLIESYRLGKVAPLVRSSVEKAILSFKSSWQRGLQRILDDGHYGFCLPEQCYIVVDTRFELILSEIVSTDPFIQHTCSSGVVHATPINTSLIEPFVSTIDTSALDIPQSLAALFVARLL